ncbi:hypothetical protein ACFX2I_004953 [Malus domestica]
MGSKTLFKWSKQITTSQVGQLIKAEKDLQKAVLVFDSATAEYTNGFRHDHTTFGLMVSRLVSANQFRSAEALLDRMKEEKCSVTEDIFLSVCRGYGRVHRPLDAVRVFHKMEDFQCKPTQKSYITILGILVEENQLKIAFKFYKYMRETGIPATVISLNILIKALCKNSNSMDSALRIFREMPNKGCTPDSYTYEGKLQEATEILDRMKLQGLKPDAGLYGKVISGFCNVFKFKEAANFLDEMVLGGVTPNRLTWGLLVRIHNAVVQGLCSSGDQNRAFQLYLCMRTRGISIDMKTFYILVKCISQKGDLHKAYRIVEEMVLDGCVPDEGIWSAMVDGFWNRKKVREPAELLQAELMTEVVEPETLI